MGPKKGTGRGPERLPAAPHRRRRFPAPLPLAAAQPRRRHSAPHCQRCCPELSSHHRQPHGAASPTQTHRRLRARRRIPSRRTAPHTDPVPQESTRCRQRPSRSPRAGRVRSGDPRAATHRGHAAPQPPRPNPALWGGQERGDLDGFQRMPSLRLIHGATARESRPPPPPGATPDRGRARLGRMAAMPDHLHHHRSITRNPTAKASLHPARRHPRLPQDPQCAPPPSRPTHGSQQQRSPCLILAPGAQPG